MDIFIVGVIVAAAFVFTLRHFWKGRKGGVCGCGSEACNCGSGACGCRNGEGRQGGCGK